MYSGTWRATAARMSAVWSSTPSSATTYPASQSIPSRRCFTAAPGRVHAGNGQQRRLHLAELDAESAQLDLSVAAPQVFDAVAGHRRITGEVHPAAIGIGRIRDEPGSGQVEHAGVPARDLIARDVKVAWHTVGNRAQPAVEDLGAHALDRVSDVGCVRDRDELGVSSRRVTYTVVSVGPYMLLLSCGPRHRRRGGRRASGAPCSKSSPPARIRARRLGANSTSSRVRSAAANW